MRATGGIVFVEISKATTMLSLDLISVCLFFVDISHLYSLCVHNKYKRIISQSAVCYSFLFFSFLTWVKNVKMALRTPSSSEQAFCVPC